MKQEANLKANENEGQEGKSFKKWGYLLAWVSFLASVGLAIVEVLEKHKPPSREQYE